MELGAAGNRTAVAPALQSAEQGWQGIDVRQRQGQNVPACKENITQTVNIRQLKSNPSAALRSAREDDMVVVMNRDHPQPLLVDLEKLNPPDLGSVRVALAVSLFRSGAISAGFAACMAYKPLPEMLTLLSSLGIPLTGANATDARDDLTTGKRWLAEKV